MDQKKTRLLVLALGLVLLLGGAALLYGRLSQDIEAQTLGTQQSAPSGSAAESGSAAQGDGSQAEREQMPDFTVVAGDGNPVSLSDFFGKPIILNFWASWCGPCKSEMPDFEEAYLEYGDEIQFLMVNLTDGSQETMEEAKAYIQDQGYTFPVYYDTQLDAAITYGASTIPMTFFIDKDGYGAAYARTALSRETLQQGIDMIYPGE